MFHKQKIEALLFANQKYIPYDWPGTAMPYLYMKFSVHISHT